jgi:hypothetical protein
MVSGAARASPAKSAVSAIERDIFMVTPQEHCTNSVSLKPRAISTLTVIGLKNVPTNLRRG